MQPTAPGPKGVPVLGNVQQFARDPLKFLTACRDAYGDIAKIEFGSAPMFVLFNPSDIKQAFSDTVFQRPDPLPEAQALLGEGLLMTDGLAWRRQRLQKQPAFDWSRLQSFDEMMTRRTGTMINNWPNDESIPVDIEMGALTVKIISEAMFDVDLSDEVINDLMENVHPLGEQFVPDPIRFLTPSWLPTSDNRRFQSAIEGYENIISEIVRERRNTEYDEHRGKNNGVPMDLLSILLRAQHEKPGITEETIRDSMMTMLLAGHDTTALMLTYSWHLLAQHPDVEARLHDELDDVLDGSTPTAEDVHKLEYTKQILKESMRLYPPVWRSVRQVRTGVRLSGYQVPAGSLIFLPQWAVHRDPRWYDDPEKFDPSRWRPEREVDRPDYAYFPFGGGRHRCIGESLSMLEGGLILATVAQQYRLELTSDEPLNLMTTLTIHPKDPVEMLVRKR